VRHLKKLILQIPVLGAAFIIGKIEVQQVKSQKKVRVAQSELKSAKTVKAYGNRWWLALAMSMAFHACGFTLFYSWHYSYGSAPTEHSPVVLTLEPLVVEPSSLAAAPQPISAPVLVEPAPAPVPAPQLPEPEIAGQARTLGRPAAATAASTAGTNSGIQTGTRETGRAGARRDGEP
jgi:hypothetical protein